MLLLNVLHVLKSRNVQRCVSSFRFRLPTKQGRLLLQNNSVFPLQPISVSYFETDQAITNPPIRTYGRLLQPPLCLLRFAGDIGSTSSARPYLRLAMIPCCNNGFIPVHNEWFTLPLIHVLDEVGIILLSPCRIFYVLERLHTPACCMENAILDLFETRS